MALAIIILQRGAANLSHGGFQRPKALMLDALGLKLHATVTIATCGVCWLVLGQPTVDAVLHFEPIRILSWTVFAVVSCPLFVFTWMVQGHVIGRLYRQGLRRLAWFVPASAPVRERRTMSPAILVSAIAATAFICAAGWGAHRGVAALVASRNTVVVVEKCPFRGGSRLTYCWERSDGGGGLTTYAFDPLPGGKLKVTVSVRLSNRPDV